MKQSEIRVGHRYTDGKGRERYIVENASASYFGSGRIDHDCVAYCKIQNDIAVHGRHVETRAAFARWAKEEVKP